MSMLAGERQEFGVQRSNCYVRGVAAHPAPLPEVVTDLDADATTEIEVSTIDDDVSFDAARDIEEARSARLALYAGIVLLAIGSLVLYLGYNGAATHPSVVEQMPYVISGGFVGGTLVILGGVMILVHVILNARARMREDLAELREVLAELGDALTMTSLSETGASPNGFVVALREGASFHRPDCHLVSNRSGVRRMGPDEADEKGLSPCRVCKP